MAISVRKGADVASSYIMLITGSNIPRNIIIWADNCNGQNKNWCLYTALLQRVNTWGPDTVTLKHLEKGHTFMASDGVHGEESR